MKRLSFVGGLVLIVALFLSSCGPVTPMPVIVTPETKITAKYRSAAIKPDGIDNFVCTANSGGAVCPVDANGHTLTLLDLPAGVSAYFVPIPAEEQLQLQSLDKQGFICLNSINGNLTFYKDDTRELVTTFDTPVTIKVTYTYGDLKKVQACGSKLEANELWQDLVPVYLYMAPDDVNVNVWKPFSKYSVEPLEYDAKAAPETIAGTITIEFSFWGDDPKGYGSPKTGI